ncbi:hypothetical protein MHYP_G00149020 [Metynnis hypsauchen]
MAMNHRSLSSSASEAAVELQSSSGRVKKFAKFLDPDAHGRINFKDFCHGVFAIKGCEEILKTALGAPPIDRPPYQTDNGYYYQVRSSVRVSAGSFNVLFRELLRPVRQKHCCGSVFVCLYLLTAVRWVSISGAICRSDSRTGFQVSRT